MGLSKKEGGNSKGADACDSHFYRIMKDEKYGDASKNLLTQFLYRIIKIKEHFSLSNVTIGLFCNPVFLTGISYTKFRNLFLTSFAYQEGIYFKASHFADVSDNWGINFTVWKSGETPNKNDFVHTLVELNDMGTELVDDDEKILYNLDNVSNPKLWLKEPIAKCKSKKVHAPPMSTGINVKKGKNSNTSIFEDALGCYLNTANDVYNSVSKVALFTSCDSSNANGLSVMPENYEQVVAMFSARKLATKNWHNAKDVFFVPNENHEKYKEYVNDSMIYSLFNSASNQSSLKNIEYDGKVWNIKNEFFFMSRERIVELADECQYDTTYNEAYADEDRFVYKKLQGIELSKEARAVLCKAEELVCKSFPLRETFNMQYPEYQIMNWDCGWYQIKAMCKEYLKKDYEEFVELYALLAEKMRPIVYELGFLK